jgi:hypothetical protein
VPFIDISPPDYGVLQLHVRIGPARSLPGVLEEMVNLSSKCQTFAGTIAPARLGSTQSPRCIIRNRTVAGNFEILAERVVFSS